MREILFRGKANDTGQWVYGSYFKENNGTSWIFNNKEDCFYLVDDKTVGQYTGLKSRDGRIVYEGDIVTDTLTKGGKEVRWDKNTAGFYLDDNGVRFPIEYVRFHEIVGNKWDNPDLLKELE